MVSDSMKKKAIKPTTVMEPSKDAIITLSIEGIIQSWNKGAQSLFGFESVDMLGQPFFSLIPTDYQSSFKRKFDALKTSYSIAGLELPHISQNGKKGEMWLSMKLMLNKEGKAESVMVTAKDITIRKIESKELKLDKQVVKPLMEGLADYHVFYTVDKEGKILTWSKEAERVNGYKAKDVIGWNYSMFYPEEEAQDGVPKREMQKATERGGWETEGWRVRKDGTRFWAHVITTPIRNERGTLVGFTRAVRDMTESKKTREALGKGQSQFRILIENALDLVAVIDRAGVIGFISNSVESILGLPPKSCLGKNALDFVHTGDVGPAIENFMNVVLKKNEHGTFEFRLKHKNGTWRIFEAKGLNLLNNPYVAGIVVSARDVTKVKQLEDQMLKVSEEERQRIASRLHDELVQELAGLEFLVQVLKHNLKSANSAQAGQAAKIGRYLNQAVTKTRDLSHELYPIGLKEGLVQALKVMATDFQRLFNIQCVFEFDQGIEFKNNKVEAHCYYIIQEAVKNAIQHGKADRIFINLALRNNKITISVRDNGSGIPERSLRVSGIGHRVMNHRARMIDGSLDLHRNVSGGTTVICTFPANQKNNKKEKLYGDKNKKKV